MSGALRTTSCWPSRGRPQSWLPRRGRPEHSSQGAEVQHGAQGGHVAGNGESSPALVPRRSQGPIVQSGGMRYAVAASSEWVDYDGVRRPGGEVHAWTSGSNQTLCGFALSRSRLGRYPHVDWADIQPESGRHADAVQRVCPRCLAGPVRGEIRSGVVEASGGHVGGEQGCVVEEWSGGGERASVLARSGEM